jgi:4,5-DOPA dioxygenase extradiol
MPALFVSHGSPLLAIVDSPARRFLAALGGKLPRPEAIVAVSAHHDAPETEVTGAAHPETIHDFGGFPRELYAIRYRAPGAPELAERVAEMLRRESFPARIDARRGFDHGAWIPLYLMYPEADVPVVQVSIDTRRDAERHFALGRALRPLRDAGVLLLASGGATHNLALYMYADGRDDREVPPFVAAFNDWTARAIAERRYDDLVRWRELAPYPAENHPTPEHLLPLFVALGAAGGDEHGERIHSSYDRGLLALDAYAFGLPPPGEGARPINALERVTA